ncbi:MAG: rhomboid family intramembrane serine protease [Ferruginibacter sp.]
MANYGNSFQRTTPVVLNLIIINVIVFIAQLVLDKSIGLTDILALYPYDSGLFKPYQLVTHMFTHSPQEILHIIFNMYALWLFGTLLERVWGPKRFLIFYLACGLAAGLTQMFLSNEAAIGASGAIMGLMAAFAYLFPNTEFFIIPFPFPIKAKYMVAIIAAIDLFGGFHPGGADNIAHYAHLGGLVMGFILVIIWNKTNKKKFY